MEKYLAKIHFLAMLLCKYGDATHALWDTIDLILH